MEASLSPDRSCLLAKQAYSNHTRVARGFPSPRSTSTDGPGRTCNKPSAPSKAFFQDVVEDDIMHKPTPKRRDLVNDTTMKESERMFHAMAMYGTASQRPEVGTQTAEPGKDGTCGEGANDNLDYEGDEDTGLTRKGAIAWMLQAGIRPNDTCVDINKEEMGLMIDEAMEGPNRFRLTGDSPVSSCACSCRLDILDKRA